jgi:hypothetical protein
MDKTPKELVQEYRFKIRQAGNVIEKKRLAAELHQLAMSFDEVHRNEYNIAMQKITNEVKAKMALMDPIIQQAEELLASIEARRSVSV